MQHRVAQVRRSLLGVAVLATACGSQNQQSTDPPVHVEPAAVAPPVATQEQPVTSSSRFDRDRLRHDLAPEYLASVDRSCAGQAADTAWLACACTEVMRRFATRFPLTVGESPTMNASVQALRVLIDGIAAEAQHLSNVIEFIFASRVPELTLTAYHYQARVYEQVYRGVLSVPVVVPGDLRAQMAQLPPQAQATLTAEIEAGVRRVLDEKAEPVGCYATARDVLIVRAANAARRFEQLGAVIESRRLLRTESPARLSTCIAQARRNDPTFTEYRIGEFGEASAPP